MDIRVDHRSIEDRGIDRVPGHHIGVIAHHMKDKGIVTERSNAAREILAENTIRDFVGSIELEHVQEELEAADRCQLYKKHKE